MSVSAVLQTILYRPHLRWTTAIAGVVGTWLTLFNQGDALVAGTFSLVLLGKIFLNYLTPFVVANLGLLSRVPSGQGRDRHRR
jgi:hypothetical protein